MNEEIKNLIMGNISSDTAVLRVPALYNRKNEIETDIYNLQGLLSDYRVNNGTQVMSNVRDFLNSEISSLEQRVLDIECFEQYEVANQRGIDAAAASISKSIGNLVDAFDTYTKPLDQMPMLLNSEDGLLKLIAKSRLEDGK